MLCAHTEHFFGKKGIKYFGRHKKMSYLCKRYPENNLFTLMEETNTY